MHGRFSIVLDGIGLFAVIEIASVFDLELFVAATGEEEEQEENEKGKDEKGTVDLWVKS